ncbi:MAG: HD-GYP domain-containing protein [Sphingomicrobium sp.]
MQSPCCRGSRCCRRSSTCSTHAGRQAAIDEASRRAGSWLDPDVVAAFKRVAEDERFWLGLSSPFIDARLIQLAPVEQAQPVDEDYLDAIAGAFGQVIDAKSPYTAGHSTRVADYAERIGKKMGVLPVRLRWLRRAALLHDIGKLGVSNSILDKPARLDADEWKLMRDHTVHTRAILGRIGALTDLADIAAAHHERLDGAGYPLGLNDAEIARETRIITVCDFYDALTAERPYRAALPQSEALQIIEAEVGSAIDPHCFDALKRIVS